MEEDKIYFPQNVSIQYEIINGVGWKEIKRYIIPAILIVVGIVVLPPYSSVLFWIIKAILFTIVMVLDIVMIGLKPIHSRPNVTMEMYIKQHMAYNKRQKFFFIDVKDKKMHG